MVKTKENRGEKPKQSNSHHPISATVGNIWSPFLSPFYTCYIPFRSSGSQESNALNGVQIGVETKKLWSLQENWTELSGNFAHVNPRCENFRIVRNSLLAHECHFAHLKAIFAHHYLRCEFHSKVRKSQFKVRIL